MKQVIKYEARDGKLFDTPDEAKRRDSLIDILEWYDENTLLGDSSRVSLEDLVVWLQDNKAKVKELMTMSVEEL